MTARNRRRRQTDIWGAATETWHLAGDGAVETVADEPHAAAPTAADVRSISSVFNSPSGQTGTGISNIGASRPGPDSGHYGAFSQPAIRGVV